MATTLYDIEITGIYLAVTDAGALLVDDGEDAIGMQVTPAQLRWLARELVQLPLGSLYEGWSYGGENGDLELTTEGLLEVSVWDTSQEDLPDHVTITVDVADTDDALGLATILLDAADVLAGTESPR